MNSGSLVVLITVIFSAFAMAYGGFDLVVRLSTVIFSTMLLFIVYLVLFPMKGLLRATVPTGMGIVARSFIAGRAGIYTI